MVILKSMATICLQNIAPISSLTLCSIASSFNLVHKHLGTQETRCLWTFERVVLADLYFLSEMLNSPQSSVLYFSFYDVQNVFIWCLDCRQATLSL